MAFSDSIKGKAGIVTGAASGIGRATAVHLAQLGAKVTLVDLDAKGLEETKSIINDDDSVLSLAGDAADEAQIAEVVAKTVAKFGSIDYLVNNAGILRRTPFLEMPVEEWDLMIKVNLRGPFLFCKAVAPVMVKQGSGVIVNVASLAGRSVSILGGAHYTAGKHGVIGLTRHMARELSPSGMRVVAFCPGATRTPMTTQKASEEEILGVEKNTPRRKWAAPEEQAAVIGFLVSDAAVNITGACIDSNGGALMI